MKDKITLYKSHKNSIGTWSISYVDNVITMSSSTTLNGRPVIHTESVEKGLQTRSLHEQVLHRIRSRAKKQLDKGYVKTIEEAKKGPTNSLNLKQPMLATAFGKIRHLPGDCFMQNKLDGHRCLVTRLDGKLFAYSRQGKEITTIDHILDHIVGIDEGMTIDGELYVHGESLQTIASWVKRAQDNSSKLEYHIYDYISDANYAARLATLHTLQHGTHSKVIPCIEVNTASSPLGKYLDSARELGYEGLILRDKTSGYEAGRRSKSLIKVKKVDDAEYEVYDIGESSTGWGVLKCITKEGNKFNVSAPGTHDEKREVLVNKHHYIGKLITVEFSDITKDGIPFHPVATRWKVYI
jgi:DNA ligase-1